MRPPITPPSESQNGDHRTNSSPHTHRSSAAPSSNDQRRDRTANSTTHASRSHTRLRTTDQRRDRSTNSATHASRSHPDAASKNRRRDQPVNAAAHAHRSHPEAPTDLSSVAWPRRSRVSRDERGDYAIFIAVIVGALLFMGGLAYDGPRLIAARQDAAHAANEAARVAAATIASGGTLQQAEEAAQNRVGPTGLIYGQEVDVAYLDCVGTRVQATILTRYSYRSAMRLIRARQTIVAIGAAEAQLVLPGNLPSTLHHLGECPLSASPP